MNQTINRPAGWNSIPQTPPVEVMEFYGDQFSAPVLLHDGNAIMPEIARWSFVDDGWVGAHFTNGPSPADHEWLNESAKFWLLLSSVSTPSAPAVDARAMKLLDSIITDMEGGFVKCENCGEQEDTATLDFMPQLRELRAALSAKGDPNA